MTSAGIVWGNDVFLYRVKVELLVNGDAIDQEIVETGFRKVEYDRDRGIVINGRSVWLTGYAQRSTNEWAAIGVAPEWLKDQDMMWLKESNSNHIRWMHVAGSRWSEAARLLHMLGPAH